jgi:cytochrome P450
MNRRCVLPSNFRTYHCGAELAICGQGTTRIAWRSLRRSTYFTYHRNVCQCSAVIFRPPSLKADSSRRMEQDWLISLYKNDASWREGRRLLDRSLRPGETMSYRHIMEEETHKLLANLLATPEHFRRHIKLSVLRIRLVLPIDDRAGFKEDLSRPSHMGIT